MSIRSDQGSEEEIVPLSIVFITIGTIILLTVMAIWIVAPSTMPTKLYNIAVSFLPEGVLQVLPTPATLAVSHFQKLQGTNLWQGNQQGLSSRRLV